MNEKKKRNRFGKKLDKLMWWIIALLPIIIYIVTNLHNQTNVEFWQFMQTFAPFNTIYEMLDTATVTAFGTSWNVNYLFSYIIAVEIMHILVDVFLFVPRFAHKIIDKAVTYD